MRVKSRLKREKIRGKLLQFREGELVRVTKDLPFTPKGVYCCCGLEGNLLSIRIGQYWCVIGEMYWRYIQPLGSGELVELASEQHCFDYLKRSAEKYGGYQDGELDDIW